MSRVAHIVVSREHLRRALLVLHAIFREAERRGYDVQAIETDTYGHRAGVGVAIRGNLYTIEITELSDRITLSDAEVEAWKQEQNRFRFSWEQERNPPKTKGVPNGKLQVSLPPRWQGARCNWAEGPRGGLETKLPSLFEELERRAEEDDRRAEERARLELERRRQEQERIEQERRARILNARTTRLSAEIAAWRLAQEIREYVAIVRLRLDELEEAERECVTAWCNWAEAWSHSSDPTVNLSRIRGLDDECDQHAYPPRLLHTR